MFNGYCLLSDIFPHEKIFMVRPKKGLGQHFLTDHNLAEKIVDSLGNIPHSAVIEIGPGKGILTKYLLKKQIDNLILVEIDKEAYEYLLENNTELKDKLILKDFFDMDLSSFGYNIAIIGNFPYNISSQIFFRILEYHNRITEVVCMVQKEVADRITSSPCNKTYGILSVLLQTWYDVNYLFTVNPGAFFPKPKVKSSVIKLVRNDRRKIGCDESFYKTLIKTSFNQRRKILRNSISSLIQGVEIEDSILGKRAEQLDVEDYIELAKYISTRRL